MEEGRRDYSKILLAIIMQPVCMEMLAFMLTHSALPGRIWMVPYRRNPFFTGCEGLFKGLHERFTKDMVSVLTQGQAINALGRTGYGLADIANGEQGTPLADDAEPSRKKHVIGNHSAVRYSGNPTVNVKQSKEP